MQNLPTQFVIEPKGLKILPPFCNELLAYLIGLALIMQFLDTIINGFATTKRFWKDDCGDTLILYTTATKAESKKFKIEVTDDYVFDFFNLMVLSLAQRAFYDSNFKNFIKKSVRKYWLF